MVLQTFLLRTMILKGSVGRYFVALILTDFPKNGNSLNYLSPSNTYTLAHVFML